jgi:hypothetical protein
MRPQRDEPVRLDPATALQDRLDRRAQVVIADLVEAAAEPAERLDMTLEKRLLRLALERDHERRPRVAGAHVKQKHLRAEAAQQHLRLTPVDLGLDRRIMRERHERLATLTQLPAPLAHIARHLPLRDHHALLLDQPLPDAPRGMALLSRNLPISRKPLVDQRVERTQLRRQATLRPLTRRRQRRRERLPDRPPMNPMPARQLAHRAALPIVIPADLLEQSHSRSHPLRVLRSELDKARTEEPRSDGGGAKSDVHTGAELEVHTHAARTRSSRANRDRSSTINRHHQEAH